jgi:hypothetical protein
MACLTTAPAACLPLRASGSAARRSAACASAAPASRAASLAAPLRMRCLQPLAALAAAPRRAAARRAVAASASAASDRGLAAADPSAWITGATPNSPLVRLAAVAVAVAAASQGDKFMSLKARRGCNSRRTAGATRALLRTRAPAAAARARDALAGAMRARRVGSMWHGRADACIVATHCPRNCPPRCAQAISFLHLLAWGTWFGSMMYTTFVVGIVMFKALPRQTFRDVQARCASSPLRACTLAHASHTRARVACVAAPPTRPALRAAEPR